MASQYYFSINSAKCIALFVAELWILSSRTASAQKVFAVKKKKENTYFETAYPNGYTPILHTIIIINVGEIIKQKT